MAVVDGPGERVREVPRLGSGEPAEVARRVVRSYGRWESPLTPDSVAAMGGVSWPSVVGPETWWCASQPASATVRLLRCAASGEAPCDVLGDEWTVSNGAIGYGGRPYLVVPGDECHRLVFTNGNDGRLYVADVPRAGRDPESVRLRLRPRPLTPADEQGTDTSYADPVLGPGGGEVWCVREVVREGGECPGRTVSRDIVAVRLPHAEADPAAPPPGAESLRVVGGSHDFLSGIRVSPDGSRICWIGWDHPDMPWDNSSLMAARIVEGRAECPVRVLGGDGVSVPQAEWADTQSLYAMADPDGWWNLHRVGFAGDAVHVECVLPLESECSHPIWRVGATSFAVTASGVVFRHGVGDQRIVLWDPATETLTDLAGEWADFAIGLSGDGAAVAVIASSPTEFAAPVRIEPADERTERCLPAADDPFEPWYATPERRAATRPDGSLVHFAYHPPTNPGHLGPDDELPPLIIDVHGGPTSSTGASRSASFSLFTSRGFAVASVDYGGSTGYGRAYRDRLLRNWGIVDVEDSVAVARFLAEAGLADAERTAIRGGSAGGWTALAALARTDVFCCGAVYYPISDPLTWQGQQTHDFESRYVDSLVGRLPADEEHFRRVSPLTHAGSITAPFVMLQGLDDHICRPDQAERVVAAVAPGSCRAFLRFAGEGHGFRRAESTAAALEAELALFTQVMVLR